MSDHSCSTYRLWAIRLITCVSGDGRLKSQVFSQLYLQVTLQCNAVQVEQREAHLLRYRGQSMRRGSLKLYTTGPHLSQIYIHMHRVLHAMLMCVKLVMVGVIPRWSPIADPNLANCTKHSLMLLYCSCGHMAQTCMVTHDSTQLSIAI